jgi:pyruvate dehydrogenase E2 component (dihydrolipoamide acetyltransferase)
MYLSLAYDHRIVDGAPAAQFLQKVKQILEKSSELANIS